MNLSVHRQNTEKIVVIPVTGAVTRGIWKQVRYDSARIIMAEIENVATAQ